MEKVGTSKGLRAKMAASVSGTGVSMVPAAAKKAPLPTPTDDTVPDVKDMIGEQEDLQTLDTLIKARLEVDGQYKMLEKARDSYTDRIKTILATYGINKATCRGALISYTQTERKTINRLKLEGLGVDPAIIDTATDISISAMLKITPPKGA
jgi:hypothetical protein